jgi:hypothetical protein
MKALTRFLCVLNLTGFCVACGGGGGGSTSTPPPPPPPVQGAPDSGAVYVYTRDGAGVWSQQAYIKASNTDAQDAFGGSIALSGNTLAVGAGGEGSAATGIDGDQSDNSASGAGAVYVYTRDAAGVWSQQAYIKTSSTESGDSFGGRVALSGDTLAVAASGEDSAATGIDGDQSDNSTTDAGAVYVFTRDAAGVWSQQAYVKASNPDTFDEFGITVALSGNRLAVGARVEDSAATGIDGDQSDNSASGAGAVYVFTRDAAGVWSQQAYIKESNTDAGDFFGRSLALSGDMLAVGARHEASAATGIDGDQSDNRATDAGAAYVFAGDAAGVWSQQAYVKASNTEGGDIFGTWVELSGDRLAVGATLEDSAATGIAGDESDNSAMEGGAAYVFMRDAAGVWSQQAYVKASNTEAGDQFGRSVTLSGDTLAVAARKEDSAATGIDGDQSDNSATWAGAVYVYTRDAAGVWSQQAYVKASNTDADDSFGWSVELSGDTLAVGTRWEDSAATGIDGDQSNTGFSGTVVAVHAFGSDPNAINPNSSDVMPVAVLGSLNFDATQVDFSKVEFGPGKTSPIHGGHVEDVNNDDIFDMVFHFNTQDTGITCEDPQATLAGETFGGHAITGTYSVKIGRCQ